MKNLKLNIICLGISITIMVISFFAYNIMDYHDGQFLLKFIAFPFIIAGMFAFRSGTGAMWLVILIEISIGTIAIRILVKVINSLRQKKN